MTVVSAQRLAALFVEIADTMIDDFDVIEFLQTLTRGGADLSGAAAVGVLLADADGQLVFTAGSDENIRLLELFQLQNQQGPCLDAFRSGVAVVNVHLSAATPRWPMFAPRAVSAGYHSVHAFPLRVRRQRIGALNAFGATDNHGLDETDIAIMQALADVAAIALLQQRSVNHSHLVAEQLQGALTSRIIIEQAKGAIAQAAGITVDQAFAQLRAHARRTNNTLTDTAANAVTDPAALTRILRPPNTKKARS